ncbi:MAG: DnaD domain protein [Bacteroidales bacterium]|nr:DnaD domain protein [Clostridium sp.]MCM1203660.1 DnaD domain protein [Bacteroidales bacterium]
METITITTKNHETYSAISNFFIDYYMTEANGEFVKIYLYLVRLLNSGRAVTVAEIADHFNLTEKDICRAIKYWIEQKVLELNYSEERVPNGITMLPLTARTTSHNRTSLLSMLGVENELPHEDYQSDAEAGQEAEVIKESVTVPKKISYKPAFIAAKKEDEDFGNLLYQTETYFGKPLTQSDVNSLLYIYEELSFHPDLLEYLVEYCVSIGKKSCRYIEAVALEWYKNGITTVEDAKVASKNYNSVYVAVLKQLGIPRRVPTPAETAFIDTWYNTYSFNKNIILEACKRAIASRPQSANFNYVNGILESWYKQNVHKLSDIDALDKKWAAEKKRKSTSGASAVNQFNRYQSSTSESTVDEFEHLFLQETNQ